MPSGRVHAFATCVAGGTLAPIIYLTGQPIFQALALAGGCLVGLVVTPDLDVDHRTYSDRVMTRSTGGLIGALWRLFWLPYAQLIPHRHPLSHWPILGTVLRLFYLLFIPALLWWIVGRLIPLPGLIDLIRLPFIWWLITGLTLVDALHWGMDRIF